MPATLKTRHGDEPLAAAARKLAAATGASRILLFGSRARGAGTADSDVDWCCVVPDGIDIGTARRRAEDAFPDRLVPMDFFVVRESDFEAGSFFLAREVRATGIAVHPEQTLHGR